MELNALKSHAERLFKEPLVWVGAVVLCIPFLGSGKLGDLRDALRSEPARIEPVEIASASMGREAYSQQGESNGSKPDHFAPNYDQQATELPRASRELARSNRSTPVAGAPSNDAAYEPSSSAPKLSRDPGSLHESADSLDWDPESELAYAPSEPGSFQPATLELQDKNEGGDFDFLFGEEAKEDTAPQKLEDGDSKPLAESQTEPKRVTEQKPVVDAAESAPSSAIEQPEAFAPQRPEAVPMPTQESPDWLFSQDPAVQGDPGSIEPLENGEFFPEPTLDQGSATLDPHAGSQSYDPGVWPQGSEAMVGTEYPVSMDEGSPVYGYEAPGCSTCSTPIYESVVDTESHAKANHTISLTGLVFQRDYEDNRRLASNLAGGQLFTNDADEQIMHGYAVSILRRSKRGIISELSYWSLNPGPVSAEVSGSPVETAITGLSLVNHPPTGENLFDVFTYSELQRITRDTNINNVEFNLFKSGGNYFTPKGRQAGYKIVGGFRWFDFDEELLYESLTDTATYPAIPAEFHYRLRARNTLIGLQGGFQHELHFGAKLRIFNLVYGGLYNNRISTDQSIIDSDGVFAEVGGNEFNFANRKNDLSFLGQLDLGILYQLSCRSRIRFGYRVIGVSGVALAADQLPYQYDVRELSRVPSNGNLLLDGGYYGIEFAF